MLYHPDKNKSESAKRKFQNISQAYEVLNNHQARKRYDRSIMINENIQENTTKTNYTYASVYKSKVDPMGYKYFNFDEWTRQHYGQAFDRKRKEKKFTKPDVRTSYNENGNKKLKMYCTMLFVTIYCVLISITSNNYDKPKEKKKT